MVNQLFHRGLCRAPEVTVILTTYDRPRPLREALASLRAQHGVQFEVVVINDAGCDVSEVIADFNVSLSLRYINLEQNSGSPAARNAGYRRARGRFIAYLDDDDLYLPDHLAHLAARLGCTPEVGLVYSDALLLRERRAGDNSRSVERRVLAQDYDHATMLRDCFIPPSSMMHRRECFERAGGFDETLRWCYDDWDFLLRVGAQYIIERVAGVSVAIRLRDDGSNLSSIRRPERMMAASYLQRRYGVAEIKPKTFWEVAETLSRTGD